MDLLNCKYSTDEIYESNLPNQYKILYAVLNEDVKYITNSEIKNPNDQFKPDDVYNQFIKEDAHCDYCRFKKIMDFRMKNKMFISKYLGRNESPEDTFSIMDIACMVNNYEILYILHKKGGYVFDNFSIRQPFVY